jgi:predicted DNA-binding transcriptional regulator AlpA
MLETDLVPDGQVGLIPRQLTEEQVASILGVSVAWCQRMRWAGGGPPYRKIARAVRYPEDLLRAWIEQHPLRTSTAALEG